LSKYIYISLFVGLLVVAGILLALATVSKKPAQFRLALVYSGDTWGSLKPCG